MKDKLKIAGLVNDSVVDGPGIRLAVFTQGCSHGCKGCHNVHTHNPEAGQWMLVDDIIAVVKKNPLLDGITITGGEPFLQPEGILQLARKIKALHLHVMAYTGFYWDELLKKPSCKAVLKYTDILVDGPFLEEEKSLSLPFRGSANQRMILVQESLFQGKVVCNNSLI